MKFQALALIALTVLGLSLSAQAADPAPCSVSVGIVPRTGLVFRTWANALEVNALENYLGLKVCQNDDRDLQDQDTHALCNTEFYIQLIFTPDQKARVLSIFRRGKRIFTQNYDEFMMSQKIMKKLPTCAELEKLPVLKKK